MPDFTFTSPEGKSYTVSGPEGATQEQAWGMLQSQLGGAAAPAPAPQGANGYLDAIKTGAQGTAHKVVGIAGHLAEKFDQAFDDTGIEKWWNDHTMPAGTPQQPSHVAQDHAIAQAADQASAADSAKLGATTGGAGIAGNVAAGLSYAPFGWAAPIVAGGAEGGARYQEDKGQGIDDTTAMEDAVLHGGINAFAQLIPMGNVAVRSGLGRAVATTLGAGARAAAVGAGQAVADDYGSGAILDAQGYPTQAAERTAHVGKDAIEGAEFMAGLHVGTHAIKSAVRGDAAPAPAAAPPAPPVVDPATGQPLTVRDQLRGAAGDAPVDLPAARLKQLNEMAEGTPDQRVPNPDGTTTVVPGKLKQFMTPAEQRERATLQANQQRDQAAQKLEGAITDSTVSLDDTIAAANDLIARPSADLKIKADALTEQAAQNARNRALQEQLDAMGTDSIGPEGITPGTGGAAEQARLAKLQEAIDMHAQLLEHANAQANTTAREIAQRNALDPLSDLGNRTDTARPDVRSPEEIAATTNDPILKQLFMNRIREDAGMTPGADSLTSSPMRGQTGPRFTDDPEGAGRVQAGLTKTLAGARMTGHPELDEPIAQSILGAEGFGHLGAVLNHEGIQTGDVIGNGMGSIVLDAGDHVLRLGHAERGAMVDAPVDPEVIAPVKRGVVGKVRWELMPKADTSNVTPADVAQLRTSLASRGIEFTDSTPDNVGRVGGRLMVIDPDAVEAKAAGAVPARAQVGPLGSLKPRGPVRERAPQYPDAPGARTQSVGFGENPIVDAKPMDFHEATNRLDVLHGLRERAAPARAAGMTPHDDVVHSTPGGAQIALARARELAAQMHGMKAERLAIGRDGNGYRVMRQDSPATPAKAGGLVHEPGSLSIVPHPTEAGKYAIAKGQRPADAHDLENPQPGNKAPAPPSTDPVKLYVDAQRATNTPAARHFVGEYEAGRITDEDVKRAMVESKRSADSVDQNMTSAGNVLERAGRDSLPLKPRGQSELRDQVLSEGFARTPNREAKPPETEPPAPPAPPAEDAPLSKEEFAARLPVADDNHTLKTAVQGRSVADAAEHLAKSKNPIIAKVGEQARKLVGKARFIPWPSEARLRSMVGMGSDVVGGFYSRNSDEVAIRAQRTVKGRIAPSMEGNEHVVAHELSHAVTVWGLVHPTPEQAPHAAAIEKLFAHVQGALKGERHYGLTNVREFVAEAFTNPEFQHALSKIKYGTTDAWTQFVHSVAKLLGFKESNALTEVLRLGEKLGDTERRSSIDAHGDQYDLHGDASGGKLTREADRRFAFASDLTQAVRHAANTSGEFGKAIADLVTPYIKDTKFRVLGKSMDGVPADVAKLMETSRGVFVKSLHRGLENVFVNGSEHGEAKQGVNNVTVLHEALHAATARKVYLGSQQVARGSELGKHVAELNALRAHVKDQFEQAKEDGHPISPELEAAADIAFNNNREFITYGMTHETTQEFLRQVPGMVNRTAWGDFVGRVRDILGMDAKHTSALADLIDVTHRIATTEADAATKAAERQAADEGLAEHADSPENGAHGTDQPEENAQVRRAPGDVLPRGGDRQPARDGAGVRPTAGTPVDAARADRPVVQGVARGSVDAGGAGEPGVAGKDGAAGRGAAGTNPDVQAANRPLSPEAQRGAGAPAAVAVGHVARFGGRALDAVKGFSKSIGVTNIVDDLQRRTLPMSDPAGTDRARAESKSAANKMRLAQAQWMRFDDILAKNYTREQRERMWDAADEENLIRGKHMDAAPDKGLASLPDDQRATVETLHNYSETLLARGLAVGMFPDGGLPYWTPRMAVMIGENGEITLPPGGAGSVGVDVTTSAPSAKARKYLTADETEAAQQKLLNTGDKNAMLVRDIRAMPLAMARLEKAIAGRELVESIRHASTDSGFNAVSDHASEGFFTLNHPAFKTFMPVTKPDINGKMVTVLHEQPLYIRNEYKGPLQSIMYEPGEPWYQALMAVKKESTGLIMYSPLIHNEVIFGKALTAVNFNPVRLVSLYVKGNALRTGADFSTMREAISNGMAPIGNFGAKQDLTGIAADHDLQPGQGWKSRLAGTAIAPFEPVTKPVAKAAGMAVGALAKPAGDVVGALGAKRLGDWVGKSGEFVERMGTREGIMKNIDDFGHLWHNTLLWDRVADLQVGLYAHIKEQKLADFQKVMPADAAERAAGLIAAHWANRYAGSLPNEAMSASARKWANLALFSRSFTLGNIALYKDAMKGLPADIRSQMTTEFGSDAASLANKAARRKAAGTLMLEIGALYAMNSVLQDAMTSYKKKDDDHGFWSNMGDQMEKYGPRAQAALAHARDNAMDVLPLVGHPFKWLHSFTSNGANEPGKEARIRGFDLSNGTATYYRSPLGKVGEDLEGWLSAPGHTAWTKVGTLLKPAIEIAQGKDGADRPLWAPSDSALTVMGKAAAHFMEAQVPFSDAKTVIDLARASTNPHQSPKEQEAETQKRRKLLLPLATGVTVSQGFPGGPAAGAAFHASQDSAGEKAVVMPQVHQLLATGDPDDRAQAIDLMRGLRMTVPAMIQYLKGQEAPASRLTASRLTKLARENPEGYAEVQKVRDAAQ